MRKIIITAVVSIFFYSGGCINAQENISKKANAKTIYTYGTATAGGTGKFYLGREIAQVIAPSGAAWLDRASRPDEEHTQLAIDHIQISSTGVIADIGAGTGYYTFKLAPKVSKGKVYAVEIQDEMIAAINERKKKLNMTNVEVVKGDIKTPNLPDNTVDLAIMVDVYHELEYPVEMLQSIRRALKKDGKFLLIEYKGEDPTVAIRPLHKTTVAQLSKELGANGFKLDYDGQFMPIQHFLLFRKE